MSRVMCHEERGSDSLLFVFVREDSEKDSIHAGFIREDAHGPGSSPDLHEAPLDGIGGTNRLSPDLVLIDKEGE